MPTSESLSPSAQTISVAEGRKETILGIGVRIKSYDDRNSAIGVINHELCSCKHFRADQCVVAFAQNHLDRSLFAEPFDLTQRHGGRHLCATNQLKDQSRDDWKIQAFNDRGGKYESAIETCVEYAFKRLSVRKAYFDNSFATRINATGFLWHDRRWCALSLDRRARGRRACRALRGGQR